MDNLYSVCVMIDDYCQPEKGREMFFVGIFDEKHVRKGIKDFITIKERKNFPEHVKDDYVENMVSEYADNTVLEEILSNPELILNIVGTCYVFFVNSTECNTVNNNYMMSLDI